VLLAEDDADLRRLIGEALERDGYRVKPVKTGVELWAFLDRAASDPGLMVDVVVSDIIMPGCTGLEVLGALRQRDWATPVVLITAFGDEETKSEARRLGAAIFIDKPFQMEELRHAVRSLVPPVLVGGQEED
jgi:DNA-binding response OmpR family regulator